MKKLSKKLLVPISLSLLATNALADHNEENSRLQDAWLDGKMDTVILLNKHLNPFDIESDVINGEAKISGSVESDVHKQLATELALSIDGIESVDNQIMVAESSNEPSELETAMVDASITTAISTKLLLNTEINSLNINVDTDDQTVTLVGEVDSDVEKELVEQIASNTSNVEEVINRLKYTN